MRPLSFASSASAFPCGCWWTWDSSEVSPAPTASARTHCSPKASRKLSPKPFSSAVEREGRRGQHREQATQQLLGLARRLRGEPGGVARALLRIAGDPHRAAEDVERGVEERAVLCLDLRARSEERRVGK